MQEHKIDYTQIIDQLLNELFPICRSITGDGVRQTLARLSQESNFDIVETKSGTQVFDWKVPQEWSVEDAYVEVDGTKIIDFKNNNLHLISYSEPIDAYCNLEELKQHLYYLESLPDAIPYRTSYYKRAWGFCLSYNQFKNLPKDKTFHVVIKTSYENGSLTYAESKLLSTSNQPTLNILMTAYCCHPSMANDSLSGIILLTLLKKYLEKKNRIHNYSFVIAPETIGALTYIYNNHEEVKSIDAGFVITTVGGPGVPSIKESFNAKSLVDRIAHIVLRANGPYKTYPFVPDGSDERQYSSPGLRIPCVTIAKDKYYEYPYYHTSLDDLNFVKASHINETLNLYIQCIELLERNIIYARRQPVGEVQLGPRGLYPTLSGHINQNKDGAMSEIEIISWLLFCIDGKTDLVTILEKTKINYIKAFHFIDLLLEKDIIFEVINE